MTRKEIEEKGWHLRGISRDGGSLTFLYKNREERNIPMYMLKFGGEKINPTNEIKIEKIIIPTDGNPIFESLFEGECDNIKSLKEICRYLKIE